MERTVLLSSPYVIDRYRVESEEGHTYDWVVHVDAQEGLVSVDQQPLEGPLGERCGYEHNRGAGGRNQR